MKRRRIISNIAAYALLIILSIIMALTRLAANRAQKAIGGDVS